MPQYPIRRLTWIELASIEPGQRVRFLEPYDIFSSGMIIPAGSEGLVVYNGLNDRQYAYVEVMPDDWTARDKLKEWWGCIHVQDADLVPGACDIDTDGSWEPWEQKSPLGLIERPTWSLDSSYCVAVVNPSAPAPERVESLFGPFASQPLAEQWAELNITKETKRTFSIFWVQPHSDHQNVWGVFDGIDMQDTLFDSVEEAQEHIRKAGWSGENVQNWHVTPHPHNIGALAG